MSSSQEPVAKASFPSSLSPRSVVSITGSGDRNFFIEMAYHLMAVFSGIQMSECRLMEDGGRAHFMTRQLHSRRHLRRGESGRCKTSWRAHPGGKGRNLILGDIGGAGRIEWTRGWRNKVDVSSAVLRRVCLIFISLDPNFNLRLSRQMSPDRLQFGFVVVKFRPAVSPCQF